MALISFQAKLVKLGSLIIVVLPKAESVKLPSRGMVMVQGTVNGSEFQVPLEPDGRGSHWFEFSKPMQEAVKLKLGAVVSLEFELVKDWSDPEVPKDFKEALKASLKARDMWSKITPIARWDWIRWIRSTKEPATRKRRIEVACSKLEKGMRRPCCFNRSMCTEPYVSNNGVLLEPPY